jgi:AmmeMemoRadiSam system protein A
MTLPEIAFNAIKLYLTKGEIYNLEEGSLDFQKRAGVFVSIHRRNGDLRGCIGTILPTRKNINEEAVSNAITAATKDYRFEPIGPDELDDLVITVDVLSEPEKVTNTAELDPKKYGVIVSTSDGKSGLLLPDLSGVETVNQQISICLQKGGISPDEKISVSRFTVTRYDD